MSPWFLLFKGVSCNPGEVVFGCVLDWDLDKKLVLVSLTPEIAAERKAVQDHKGRQKKVKLLKIVRYQNGKRLKTHVVWDCTLLLLALSHNIPYKFR